MKTLLLAALAVFATVTTGVCAEPVTTPDFVKKAAQFNRYEIATGNIASEKGQSEAVKQFGRDIVAAHSKAAGEFKGILQGEKLNVKVPTKPSKKQKEAIEALSAAAQADFDKAYAEQQIAALERAIEIFDAYAATGDNAALKQFAANTLATLKQHLEQAKKLMP